MSRLAEAEAVERCMDALENAIDTVLAEKRAAPQPTDKAVSGSDGGIDRTKIWPGDRTYRWPAGNGAEADHECAAQDSAEEAPHEPVCCDDPPERHPYQIGCGEGEEARLKSWEQKSIPYWQLWLRALRVPLGLQR